MFLVLVCDEGKVTEILATHQTHVAGILHQGPCDYARSTIRPELEIKVFTESGVELNTHVEIIHGRSCLGQPGWSQ